MKNCDTVYNPISVVKCLKAHKFDNYWFDTATPTVLINELVLKPNEFKQIFNDENDEITTTIDLASDKLVNNNNIVLMMFQTGYLTIKEKNGDTWYLQYPNKEVGDAFIKFFCDVINDSVKNNITNIINITSAEVIFTGLKNEKIIPLIKEFNSFITQVNSLALPDNEKSMQIFACALLMKQCNSIKNNKMKFDAERNTGLGRLDLIISVSDESHDIAWIIELKYITQASICKSKSGGNSSNYLQTEIEKKCQEGIKQIKEKQYLKEYTYKENHKVIIASVVGLNREFVYFESQRAQYNKNRNKFEFESIKKYYMQQLN